jgi:hypothetical protein
VNNATDIRHWLFEEFSSRLATVFETMSGERPAIDLDQALEMPAGDSALRWHQPFSGVPGAAWVIASEAGWATAGGYVLRAAGIEESDPASLKSTYMETVSQALAGIAGAMGGRVGREVNCSAGEESSHAAGGDTAWAILHIHLGTETTEIAFGLEPALIAAMGASPQSAGVPAKTA